MVRLEPWGPVHRAGTVLLYRKQPSLILPVVANGMRSTRQFSTLPKLLPRTAQPGTSLHNLWVLISRHATTFRRLSRSKVDCVAMSQSRYCFGIPISAKRHRHHALRLSHFQICCLVPILAEGYIHCENRVP
jgi:hypothetical protein